MKTNGILFLALGALLLWACSTSSTSTESHKEMVEEVEETAFFVADPQPIEAQEVEILPIGSRAPDFRLPGVDGKFHSLSDYADAQVLVIIFTCNHCPTAQAYEDRMIQLTEDYAAKGVQVVAISPNSPLGLLYEELGYSDLGDDFEEMVIRAEYKEYNFPYLYDGDDHAASLQYGPAATPHSFVFDKDRILRYVGRLDASEKPGSAQAEDIRAAIDALLAGEEVSTPETKTFGCSTKWAWKTEYKEKVEKEWAAKEVSLDNINEAGIKDLIANDSDKLRLINIWATWCGPCVMEYPSFIEIHRMFQGRDFEFISLSADTPDQKEAALKFLQKSNSAVTNYIFEKDDKYALIEAVDPDWQGALPYTLIVAPGGEKLYAKQGIIDPLEVKRIIVESPMIGRYY